MRKEREREIEKDRGGLRGTEGDRRGLKGVKRVLETINRELIGEKKEGERGGGW